MREEADGSRGGLPVVSLDRSIASPMVAEAREAMEKTLDTLAGRDLLDSGAAGREAAGMIDACTQSFTTYFECDGALFFPGAGPGCVRSTGLYGLRSGRPRVIASPMESAPVVEALRDLASAGCVIETVPVGSSGRIDPAALESVITDETCLVTVELASPESAVMQPVSLLSEIAHRHGAMLHTDLSAAVSRIGLSLGELGADTASVSGCALGGPAGFEALLVSGGVPEQLFFDMMPTVLSMDMPSILGADAALARLTRTIGNVSTSLRRMGAWIIRSLRREGLDFLVVGGDGDLLPGAMLLRLGGPAPPERLHERLEMEGFSLPCPRSARRTAWLSLLGLDGESPERYLGLFPGADTPVVDLERALGAIVSWCGTAQASPSPASRTDES